MANELAISYAGTATIYVITRRLSDATVRDQVAAAWDAWVDGDIGDYDLPLVSKGGDLYAVSAHSGLVSGVIYRFTYYKQAGANPAITDTILASDEGTWNGSTVTPTPTPSTTATGTTYCDSDDVESIMSTHGVTAYVDDNLDGSQSAAEAQYVTDAISRAANLKMNIYLGSRYKFADLSANVWCKWANATFAALLVSIRRNNPAPQSLIRETEELTEMLKAVQKGQLPLPSQSESFDTRPTVSNFDVERYRGRWPVRVREDESTGDQPVGGITRHVARTRHTSD